MTGELWFDAEGQRWYVVPDECAARSGSLSVKDVHGNARTLDPEQAAPWEVDEATGRARLEDELRGQAEQIQATLGGLVQAFGGKTLDLDDEEQGADAVAAAFKGLVGALGGMLSEDPEVREKAGAKLQAASQVFAKDESHSEKLRAMGEQAQAFVREAVDELDDD